MSGHYSRSLGRRIAHNERAMEIAVLAVLELLVIARVLYRPHRDPASRVAWIVVIVVLPLLGMIAYLFLGETSIGRRRKERLAKIEQSLPTYSES